MIALLLIDAFKCLFGKNRMTYDMSLEEYIISNDPQSTHDVEILERQFEKLNSSSLYKF
jgi:hypothetical protein